MAVFLRFDDRRTQLEKRVRIGFRCGGEVCFGSEHAIIGTLSRGEVVRHRLLRDSQPAETIQNRLKKCRAVERLVLPTKGRETSPPDFSDLTKRLSDFTFAGELRSVAKMASQVCRGKNA